MGRLRTELAARPATEDPVDSIRAVADLLDFAEGDEEQQILARLDLMRQQPTLTSRYLDVIHQVRLVIVDFVTERSGRRDLYPLLVAGATAAAWDASLTLWAATDGTRPLRDIRREAFATLPTTIDQSIVSLSRQVALIAAVSQLKSTADSRARLIPRGHAHPIPRGHAHPIPAVIAG